MKQNKSEHLQICEKRFFRFGSSVPSVRTWELLYMMLAYSDNSHEEIKDYYRSGNLPPSPPHRHPPVELIIGGSPLQWEPNVHLPHRDLKDLVKETKLCVIGNGKLVLISKQTGMVYVPLHFYYAIGVYMLVLNPTDEILMSSAEGAKMTKLKTAGIKRFKMSFKLWEYLHQSKKDCLPLPAFSFPMSNTSAGTAPALTVEPKVPDTPVAPTESSQPAASPTIEAAPTIEAVDEEVH